MHLPIRKLAAKHRLPGRRSIRRLDPANRIAPAIRDSNDSRPSALRQEGAFGLCPRCGIPNGITAAVCWRCAAELPAPVGPRSEVEQLSGAKNPENLEPVPGTDSKRAQDLAVESLSRHMPRATAQADPVRPVALADLPRISAARSQYPTLTHVVQTTQPPTTLPSFAVVERHPKRMVLIPAALAALAILVAGAYLFAHTSTSTDGPWTRTIANRQNEPAMAPETTAPANADRAHSPSAPAGLTPDARPKVGESRAAAALVGSVKPAPAADLKAIPLAGSRARDSSANVTPPANAATLTAAQRDKARGTPRPANAAVAVQKPDIVEQRRQAPEPRMPCSAAITALGLCEPP